MYIYRVENDKKEGCYKNGAMQLNELDSHDDELHPHPTKDEGIKRYCMENEKCGFLNLKQVRIWFTKNELMRLRKNGYHLKRIKINKITAIGKFQILFKEN